MVAILLIAVLAMLAVAGVIGLVAFRRDGRKKQALKPVQQPAPRQERASGGDD